MPVYLHDTDLTVYHGDALATLRELPDESAHMCVTSPPFFGLRDYGVNGQIGLEESPDAWVASLVAVFREVHRVLRNDGTLWVEVGDSYAMSTRGAGGAGKQHTNVGSVMADRSWRVPIDCKPKDLVGAPWLLAFALRADGWYLRSDIIWARPNPMPESVTDRPTKSHSYVFLLAKQPRYFFDADAIREDSIRAGDIPGGLRKTDGLIRPGWGANAVPAARNKRSVWTIPTQPLPDQHYAAYPEALVEPCILAGTSERGVCPECGAPWVRETERTPISTPTYTEARGYTVDGGARDTVTRFGDGLTVTTTGWRPTCAHNHEPAPAVVLDPFLGSGTTALVARRLGRRCVGIELSVDYCRMIARRTQQLSLLGDAS